MSKEIATAEGSAPQSETLATIERLVTNPDVSIAVLEKLFEVREKEENNYARKAFNSAMSLVQKDTQAIAVNADNPHTRSRYATLAAFDKMLRPIYTKHGLDVFFITGDAIEGHVNLVCIVSHRDGGERRASLAIPVVTVGPQGKAVMTPTHATVSAVSYGKRTLLGMVFNIAVDKDDDGNAAGSKPLTGEELDELLEICDVKGLSDTQRLKFCEIHKVKAFSEIHSSKFEQAKKALLAYEVKT